MTIAGSWLNKENYKALRNEIMKWPYWKRVAAQRRLESQRLGYAKPFLSENEFEELDRFKVQLEMVSYRDI